MDDKHVKKEVRRSTSPFKIYTPNSWPDDLYVLNQLLPVPIMAFRP